MTASDTGGMGASDDGAAGRRIREARTAAGLTQLELAVAAHTTPETISKLETGRRDASRATLEAAAGVLGVSVDWLITGDSPPELPHVAAGAAWEAFLRMEEGRRMTPGERATLEAMRFVGLEPTPQAYTVLLAGLRMCRATK